jgi:hypothetical protein
MLSPLGLSSNKGYNEKICFFMIQIRVYSVSVNLNTNIRKRNDMCVFKSHNIIVFGLKLHCTMEIWYLSNETVIGYGVQIIIKKNIGFLFFLRTCRIIAIESILYILYADLNLQKWSPTELMRYHPVGECLGAT